MTAAWWERVLFQLALAFWSAYFTAKRADQEAEDEVSDEKARARAARFRAAVERVREARRHPGSDGPAPGGTGS